MDLIQEVLTDINVNYNITSNSIKSIDHNDINLIQSVLKECNTSLSTNTMQFIENRYINHSEHNLNESAVPETPFITHRKRQPKIKEMQQHGFHHDIDEDNDADSDESYVFSTISRNPTNHNTQNFNIFSFASNETEISNMSQNIDHIQFQDTQMDIDYINDDFDFSQMSVLFNDDYHDQQNNNNNTNGVALSQSFCGLQLTQSQADNNNNNNDSNHYSKMSLSPSLTR